VSWPTGIPKTLTPAQRVERARTAALARTTIDHHLKALVGKPLTIDQRRLLASVLAEQPGPDGAP
jgi:hypothetical protein